MPSHFLEWSFEHCKDWTRQRVRFWLEAVLIETFWGWNKHVAFSNWAFPCKSDAVAQLIGFKALSTGGRTNMIVSAVHCCWVCSLLLPTVCVQIIWCPFCFCSIVLKSAQASHSTVLRWLRPSQLLSFYMRAGICCFPPSESPPWRFMSHHKIQQLIAGGQYQFWFNLEV